MTYTSHYPQVVYTLSFVILYLTLMRQAYPKILIFCYLQVRNVGFRNVGC